MYKIHKIQLPKKVGKSTYPPTPVTPPALSFGERSKVGNILWSQSQTRECHIKRLSLEDAKRELKQKQVLFNGRPEEWKGKNIVAKKHEFLSEKEMDKLKPRTPTYFEMMHRQNPIYQGAQEEDKTSVSLTSDIGTAIKYMRGTDGEVVLIDQERLPEARKGGGTSVLEGEYGVAEAVPEYAIIGALWAEDANILRAYLYEKHKIEKTADVMRRANLIRMKYGFPPTYTEKQIEQAEKRQK